MDDARTDGLMKGVPASKILALQNLVVEYLWLTAGDILTPHPAGHRPC